MPLREPWQTSNRPPTLRLSLSIWNCSRTLFLSLLHFPSALHPFFCHCLIIFSMEGTGRKRPCYSCPDLKDDVVEELIDRCDVTTSASMAGSFKPILDSTNNIITRTQESRSGLISPIFFVVTLMTGTVTTEASPWAR